MADNAVKKTRWQQVVLRAEFLFPLVVCGVFVYLLVLAQGFHHRARTFPNIVSVAAIALTIIEMVRQVLYWTRKPAEAAAETRKLPKLEKRFWLIMGLTVLFLLGVYLVGFYIPALVFIPLSMLVMGVRSWKMISLTTVITLVIIYFVFGYWLYIPLLAKLFGK